MKLSAYVSCATATSCKESKQRKNQGGPIIPGDRQANSPPCGALLKVMIIKQPCFY